MLRAPASRRLMGSVFAVVAAGGIGLGAYTLGSASSAPQGSAAVLDATANTLPAQESTVPAPSSVPASSPVPARPAAPAAGSPLTLAQAEAVAAKAASLPGRVVEWDTDQEPTGLRYDVTLLHADGTTTDVEVDTVTGRVTDIEHHDRD